MENEPISQVDVPEKPQVDTTPISAEVESAVEESKPAKKRRGKGCCFFIFVIMPLAFIFAFLMIAGVLGYFAAQGYKVWNQSFDSEHLAEDYYSVDSKTFKEAGKSVESKLKTFQESKEEVDFVEFTPLEFTAFIDSSVKKAMPKDVSVVRYYVVPAQGKWDIYIQMERKEKTLPWLIVRVEKDNIETAELFVSRVMIGDYNIAEYGLKSVVDDINSGYIEGLTLINEGDFTDRVIENIELQADKMVIKGRLR